MTEIVSLRRARKARERAARAAEAERNRIASGRNAAEKQIARLDRERLDRSLDGAQIEPE